MSLTAGDVYEALERKYSDPWLILPEVRYATGYKNYGTQGGTVDYRDIEKRIDAFAIHPWPSQNWKTIAFEIKVSRSDFLNELKQPEKRAPWYRWAQEFYFVLANGVVKSESEIPEECGYMIVWESGIVQVKRKAPVREVEQPTWSFLASCLRSGMAHKSQLVREKDYLNSKLEEIRKGQGL